MSLSSRGAAACAPALPYLHTHLGALSTQREEGRPDGMLLLDVAENRVSFPELATKLGAVRHSTPVLPSAGAYDNMVGRGPLREALAATFRRRLRLSAPLDPACLVVASGVGSLISNLTTALLEAGDAVLLPTPTYAALYSDFTVPAGAVVHDVPVPVEDVAYGAFLEHVKAGRASALAAGKRPRLLFLIHPSNPCGTILPPAMLQDVLEWALQETDLHIVVDEIYALGVFKATADAGAFVSAVEVAASLPPAAAALSSSRLHVLWGFSKDFAASGLRIGVLHTRSAPLLDALGTLGYYSAVSNLLQDDLATLLNDGEWVDAYLQSAAAVAEETARAVGAILRTARVPYVEPCSSMFVWADLARFLPPSREAAANALADAVASGRAGVAPGTAAGLALCETALKADEDGGDWWAEGWLTGYMAAHSVLLTPGAACHATRPGWFRVCYLWMPKVEWTLQGLKSLMAALSALPWAA